MEVERFTYWSYNILIPAFLQTKPATPTNTSTALTNSLLSSGSLSSAPSLGSPPSSLLSANPFNTSTSVDASAERAAALASLSAAGVQQLITTPSGQVFAIGLPNALSAAKQNVS